MAYADYYLCDVCEEKTFYDANLNYERDENWNENPITKHPWPNGRVGWMTVLCKECAKNYEVKILKKDHREREGKS